MQRLIPRVGIATLRGTFTTWNKETGKVLHPLISWQDQRASDIVRTHNASCAMKAIRCLFSCINTCWSTAKSRVISKVRLLRSSSHIYQQRPQFPVWL